MQQRCIGETETIERISVGMKYDGGELKGVVMQDVYHVLHDMRCSERLVCHGSFVFCRAAAPLQGKISLSSVTLLFFLGARLNRASIVP